jgi:ferredoxin-NADP reductase
MKARLVAIDRVGLLDAAFLGSARRDWPDVIGDLAGPPAFVRAMREALVQVGADPDNLRTEEFDGYR